MIHIDTPASDVVAPRPAPVPMQDGLRRAATMLTLAVGLPLVLVWFGLVGWGVLWLARATFESL